MNKRSTIRGGGLLLAAALMLPTAVSADELSFFKDNVTDFVKIDPKDYDFHFIDVGGYGESYFLNAFNKQGDGMSFLVSISNYAPMAQFAGTFDLSIIRADGSRVEIHQEYEADETKISTFGGEWHSDFSYLPEPPVYTILYAEDVPKGGGAGLGPHVAMTLSSRLSAGRSAREASSTVLSTAAASTAPDTTRSRAASW